MCAHTSFTKSQHKKYRPYCSLTLPMWLQTIQPAKYHSTICNDFFVCKKYTSILSQITYLAMFTKVSPISHVFAQHNLNIGLNE